MLFSFIFFYLIRHKGIKKKSKIRRGCVRRRGRHEADCEEVGGHLHE